MPVLLSHRQHIAIAIGLLCNTSCIAEILMGLFQRFLVVRNWDVQFRVKLLIEESRQYQSLCLMYQYFFLSVMDLWERPSWSAYSLYIILHNTSHITLCEVCDFHLKETLILFPHALSHFRPWWIYRNSRCLFTEPTGLCEIKMIHLYFIFNLSPLCLLTNWWKQW